MVDKTRIAAAGAGVAALAGLAAAVKVWRDRRSRTESGTAVVHVTPGAEAWIVQIEGLDDSDVQFETKKAAVTEGRTFARAHTPSRLVIHRQDGTVQRQHAYGVE